MPSLPTANLAAEKQELAAFLASGALNRAPALANLLTYVCGKYFEGQAANLKEYNLGVDALGRPPEFDPKRDSIVRVEAHRLRKRLEEYYKGEGADHPFHIVLPQGQYVPKFIPNPKVPVEIAAPAAVGRELAPLETEERPPAEFSVVKPRSRNPVWWYAAIAVTLLLCLLASLTVGSRLLSSMTRLSPAPSALPELPITGDEIRIRAGSDRPYTDGFGRQWLSDRYFTGGITFADPKHPIFNTRDPDLYRSRREGTFRYDIPLRAGVYEMRLHFAEVLYGSGNIASGGEASRVFRILANGRQIIDALDVTADAGPSAVDIRAFKDISPAADGLLHLQFENIAEAPFVNAIEIAPSVAGKLRSIRILARDHPYTDKLNRAWEADRYFSGGQLTMRRDPVSGTDDPELYRGERFGNITYSIPVPPGRYGVTLHFAETWFGPDKPGRGGVGDRVFDVLCNGVALLRNLDIYKEAHGSDRAITKTFHNLEPNAQGKIQILLIPHKNYACVNAIEVVDESK
jgi:Malectin domain